MRKPGASVIAMIFFRTSIERTHARIKAEVHASAYPKRSFVSGWGPTDQNRRFKLYITYLCTRNIHFLHVYNYISFACSLRIPTEEEASLSQRLIEWNDRQLFSVSFIFYVFSEIIAPEKCNVRYNARLNSMLFSKRKYRALIFICSNFRLQCLARDQQLFIGFLILILLLTDLQ